MYKIIPKTKEEVKVIIDGGKRLADVKNNLFFAVKAGISALEIEELAMKLIKKNGAEASFSKVPKYHWATCINVNEGVVHGIPKKEIVFKNGDVVSVDVGLIYKGFNTDTSFSKGLKIDRKTQDFLNCGKKALKNAISKAVPGNHIFDISQAIETTLGKSGYNPVRSLVGHGVGRELHEEPQIPQFTYQDRERTPELPAGAVLAIEVIYTVGNGEISYENDGWTIVTSDDKISALYEDTVIVTESVPLVVTS